MIGLLKWLLGERGEQVAPKEAMRRLSQGAVLVDVREPREFSRGHVPKALHLPLGKIRSEGWHAVDTLDFPLGTSEVLLICHSGTRSRIAQASLSKDARFRYVNVAGGLSAWVASGLPVSRAERDQVIRD